MCELLASVVLLHPRSNYLSQILPHALGTYLHVFYARFPRPDHPVETSPRIIDRDIRVEGNHNRTAVNMSQRVQHISYPSSTIILQI